MTSLSDMLTPLLLTFVLGVLGIGAISTYIHVKAKRARKREESDYRTWLREESKRLRRDGQQKNKR